MQNKQTKQTKRKLILKKKLFWEEVWELSYNLWQLKFSWHFLVFYYCNSLVVWQLVRQLAYAIFMTSNHVIFAWGEWKIWKSIKKPKTTMAMILPFSSKNRAIFRNWWNHCAKKRANVKFSDNYGHNILERCKTLEKFELTTSNCWLIYI